MDPKKQLEKLKTALGKERQLRRIAEQAGGQKAADTPEFAALREARNLGDWLEARLHLRFTEIADEMFGDGYLTREERITLSGAIGEALTTFRTTLEGGAAHLYQRPPFAFPEDFNLLEADLVPLIESGDAGYQPLLEKAVRGDGTIPVKIIEPGWGSSGYYPAEMLERDGAKVFTQGLKMYWNHPTMTEDIERPERSLRDLAAELTGNARWEAEGEDGPGLYADAKVFEAFQPAVDDLGGHIGVSIRALGKSQHGQAEGREGPIIQELVAAKSVDFVTEPGAGGKILELFESVRPQGVKPESRGQRSESETVADDPTTEPKEATVPKEKENEDALQQLQETNKSLVERVEKLEAEKARQGEKLLLREAREFVATTLEGHPTLPTMTRKRLVETLAKDPPTTEEGGLDKEAYTKQVEEAVKAELAYLAEVTGSGRITGLGGSETPEALEEAVKDVQAAEGELEEAFQRLDMGESAAKIAAAGRN